MKTVITPIRAPKGFRFSVTKERWYGTEFDTITINLHDSYLKGQIIGRIDLCIDGKYVETHSHLDYRYHNRKLGALMYAKAIQWALKNGYKVRSSGSSSSDAQRVWRGKTLRSKFRIRTIKNKRMPNVRDCDVFYAFPLIKNNGKSKRSRKSR